MILNIIPIDTAFNIIVGFIVGFVIGYIIGYYNGKNKRKDD